MAYSKELWQKARDYFESGVCTLQQIKDKTGISVSKISEKAKKEKWEKGKNRPYVEAKQELTLKAKELSETTIAVLDEVANERAKDEKFFRHWAIVSQNKANELLEMASDLSDIEIHSRITARNKETVLGKDPQAIIQNNNTNAQQTKLVIERKDIKA